MDMNLHIHTLKHMHTHVDKHKHTRTDKHKHINSYINKYIILTYIYKYAQISACTGIFKCIQHCMYRYKCIYVQNEYA